MAKKHKKNKVDDEGNSAPDRLELTRKAFEAELYKLQVELIRLQAWAVAEGARAIVVFEGRDTAGKGGVIKRITERCSPRVFKHVALPTPSDREKSQLYIQRYMTHFLAAGEIILFDRSWYNRAGVESVRRWWDYTQAYQAMIEATDTAAAPWYIVPADDKRRARLNLIRHLLDQIPYRKIEADLPKIPKVQPQPKAVEGGLRAAHIVPSRY
jgi:polyphosphate kinase 2 (PPK2 family)